jgi:heptaprenyl diphosphate synthase
LTRDQSAYHSPSGAPADTIRSLGEYGEALGIAFQLSDDLLDLSATDYAVGKPRYADLRSGVATMPVLRALGEPGPAAAQLRQLLAKGSVTSASEREAAATLVRQSSALTQTRGEIEQYVSRARAALNVLRPNAARAVLEDLCDFTLARTR